MKTSTAAASRLIALGWAAFLACSWTWCIGMYLPVLLVRDFGFAGWAVFTVPNVVGAAAMGWVLYRPGLAADLARRHRPAAVSFSVITILFHALFAGWIIRSLVGNLAGLVTLIATAGFFFLGRRRNRDLLLAACLLAVSILAFIGADALPDHTLNGPVSRVLTTNLLYLAPLCVFGFLLNPYLDLTFLRARDATAPNAGVAAFTLGFGVFFLIMLLFTYWYARILQPGTLQYVPKSIASIIAIHMMLQSAFTCAVHTRAIATEPLARKAGARILFLVALVLVYLVGQEGQRRGIAGHSLGETAYRLFLAFYGLAFPAYVWICMLPSRGMAGSPDRQKIRILGLTILTAAPMFWMGFIQNQMIWLVPGLAVVLLSRLVGDSGPTDRRTARKTVVITPAIPAGSRPS